MTSRTTTEVKSGNVPRPSSISKANVTLRIRDIKLDPTRALEPSRKKLSTIESQRIMSVFDDSIKRLKIVTALPYIVKNMDRYRVSLGVELVELIRHHFRIQNSYQEVRNQLDVLLHNRAKQTEEIEAKNATTTATPKNTEQADEKRPYSIFDDDDADLDYEEEEEDDEEEEIIEDEKIDDTVSSSVKQIEEDVKKEEDKEPSNEEIVALEASEEFNTKESELGLNEEFLQEDVADNINQMIEDEHVSESEMTLIDYEPRIQEVMRNLGLVAQQVSHSCKNVLRLFTLNQAAMMNIINNDEEFMRNEGGQSIINNMMELREILLVKLLSTPEEEIERAAYLEDISRRETHNKIIIDKLEKELAEAINERDQGIRKNNDMIRHLQTDLHQIEKFSDESIRRAKAEAEKQEMSDSKNSEQKIQRLQTEIDTLQVQLNNSITENREIEADLRAKKYKVENEVDNWIQKYDQDLGERQDEYEEIDIIYTDEKKQLMELEERFAALEKEYLGIMEERRIAREKRERAQRDLNRVVRAATTIQAFWRSYKVRKALNKKKKKQKGGKKGKGKKK